MSQSRFFLFLVAGVLAGPINPAAAATPGSTPHTYPKCVELEMSDQACHRQVIEAGGTVQPAPNSARTFVSQNFRGWSEKERWYRKYVEYCKRSLHKIKPMEDVIHHYPDFPVPVPTYLVFP